MENPEKKISRNESEQEFKFQVTTSAQGLPCIEIQHPAPEIKSLIHRVLSANNLGDPAYELKNKAGAFLQSDSQDYLLVEFWTDGYRPLVDYLNQELIKLRENG